MPLYKLSKSAPSRDIKYVQAVCYQDTFFDILTLEDGTERLSLNIEMELPIYAAYNPERE